jgi:hypothetical protein
MSYVMERLEVTDEERLAARRELDELASKYGREWLSPYLVGYFGREVELSAITGKPVLRETAVLYLVYDTEYRQVSDSPSPSEEQQ